MGNPVAEFFLLRRRRAEAPGVDPASREQMLDQLRLAQQKGAAGQCLWSHGHTAEGLRLSLSAFEAVLAGAEALRVLEGADGEDVSAVLARRGLGRRAIARVEAASRIVRKPAPETDGEMGAEQSASYRTVMRARRHVEAALRYPTMTGGQLVRIVVARWLVLALALAATVALGAYIAFPEPSVEARASAVFGEPRNTQYIASHAIDGDPATWWLLPDGEEGWIEVTLSPPRTLHKVRFLNTANPPWYDRATERYRLEVYSSDDEQVHASEGTFETLDRQPTWREVSMNVPDAERIRFTVKSHHSLGGGLTELDWEE